MRRFFNIFFLTLTIVLMALIFFFSSQSGGESEGLSDKVVEFVLRIFVSNFDFLSPENQLQLISRYSYIVRKGAHFLEYLALAFSFSSYLSTRENVMTYKKRGVIAFLFSALYSITDELHQFLSDARTPAVKDVVIDSSGAAVGVVISLLLFFIISKAIKTPPSDIQHEGLC